MSRATGPHEKPEAITGMLRDCQAPSHVVRKHSHGHTAGFEKECEIARHFAD
jgi:hypothetical protein